MPCHHLDRIRDVTLSGSGCKECLQLGQHWVHLRICLTCGHVGCCDRSIGKHATAHFHETDDPLVRSFEPGEDWVRCYVDRVLLSPSK